MTWFEGPREWIWPILEPRSAEFLESEAARLTRDEGFITALDLDKAIGPALEEARRFADSEEDRRRVADQKATTYLAVVAALVPLVVTLATAVWDKKAGSAPTWLNMLALGMAVAYASKAGLWAFTVLEVSASHRIGITDFAEAWKRPDPEQELVRDILRCGRKNQSGVNKKVTGIKMAHAFLLRAFMSFAGLLMFNIAWFVGAAIWTPSVPPAELWTATPKAALAAGLEISALDRGLSAEPAWTLLERRCTLERRQFSIVPEADRAIAAPSTLQQALHMRRGETLRLRRLAVYCGQIQWGRLRLWSAAGKLSLVSPADPAGVGSAKVERFAVRRLWPGAGGFTPTLPKKIMRQSFLLVDDRGGPAAYGEAEISPRAMGHPPRE